jgi:hypothetical protein
MRMERTERERERERERTGFRAPKWKTASVEPKAVLF